MLKTITLNPFYIKLFPFILLLLSFNFSYVTQISIFIVLLYSHYTLSFLYGSSQLNNLLSSPKKIIATLALTLMIFLLYKPIANIGTILDDTSVIFGIHYIMSEVYLFKGNPDYEELYTNWISNIRLSAHLFSYLLLLSHDIPYGLLFKAESLFFATLILYLALIWIIRRQTSKSISKKIILYDSIPIVFSLLSYLFSFKIHFYQIITLHLLIWLIFPISKFVDSKLRIKNFIFQNIVLIIFFAVISPFNPLLYPHNELILEPISPWIFWGNIFGIIHVSLSFVQSRANPKFVERFFYS